MPSFNQAEFLEAAILSILSQNYPNLEYIIIDGGSMDGSREIIQRYESSLSYWVSEPDNGQYHAINKGFEKATGDILGWLNSDDLHCPWTLKAVATIMTDCADAEWVSSLYPMTWDREGLPASVDRKPGFSSRAVLEGRYRAGNRFYGYIQQESTFWRRRLWERAGMAVPTDCGLAGDFALWLRFAQYAELDAVNVPLAGFRFQAGQQSRADGRYQQDVERAFHGAENRKRSPSRDLLGFGALRGVPGMRRIFFDALCYHGRVIRRRNPGETSGRCWEAVGHAYL